MAPSEVVHAPGLVHLHLQCTRAKRPLLAAQDVEVVVGGVQARVPLRAQRRPEDDEVLGDRRVDDVHRTHRAAGVVEDPLVLARVERDHFSCGGVLRVGRGKVGDDVGDHGARVVAVRGHRCLRELVEGFGVENIPLMLHTFRETSSLHEIVLVSYLYRIQIAESRDERNQEREAPEPFHEAIAFDLDGFPDFRCDLFRHAQEIERPSLKLDFSSSQGK